MSASLNNLIVNNKLPSKVVPARPFSMSVISLQCLSNKCNCDLLIELNSSRKENGIFVVVVLTSFFFSIIKVVAEDVVLCG